MTTSEESLREALEELTSAEAFLEYFAVPYEPRLVQINRLHILQRFHAYLGANPLARGEDAFSHYGQQLQRAYRDFVGSSAQEQKALRVFQRDAPGFVSLDDFD
ncbi:nitrogenase-stabilizing/protective protein NifW [Motiliproteus sp. SC1-56]|uniref:nitrogenase-stabilizing/protective protein NifW n=1 Tax=Motiliproteus sp. SC1-56 TaxID=2799565 RepID=UPI001A8C8E40|nr:nitrogenase-stabilizing/protective protein NifW [Motiliproteus sp. SC1-56]